MSMQKRDTKLTVFCNVNKVCAMFLFIKLYLIVEASFNNFYSYKLIMKYYGIILLINLQLM